MVGVLTQTVADDEWKTQSIRKYTYLIQVKSAKNMKRPYKQKIEGKNTDVGLF